MTKINTYLRTLKDQTMVSKIMQSEGVKELDALTKWVNSRTYQLVLDNETGLFGRSANYLYNTMKVIG